MIVHIWDPINCILRLAWRSAAAAHRLKPLSLALVFACGGSGPPPPTYTHTPPPAIVTAPPPVTWHPPPPSPFRQDYAPPAGAQPPGVPIPLGPVLEAPGGPRETLNGPPELPPLCDVVPVPPGVSRVPEPSGLALIGFAILALGAVLTLRRLGPGVPSIRWVVLFVESE